MLLQQHISAMFLLSSNPHGMCSEDSWYTACNCTVTSPKCVSSPLQMMLYDGDEVPEARFAYNLSPMSVLVKTEKRPWYDFLTKVLAIIGGTFSVVSCKCFWHS